MVNDATFSTRIPSYETMTSFYEAIEKVLQKENELVKNVQKIDAYRVLLEYYLVKEAKQCFRNFDDKSFLSIADDYFNKCLEAKAIV